MPGFRNSSRTGPVGLEHQKQPMGVSTLTETRLAAHVGVFTLSQLLLLAKNAVHSPSSNNAAAQTVSRRSVLRDIIK